MKKSEIDALAGQIAPAIKRFVQREMEAFIARLAAVEAARPLDGKDGVGISGAMLDREGALILTLTDGRTLNVGNVAGKDGADGKSVDMAKVSKLIDAAVKKAVADIPVIKGDPGEPGKDGEPGRDGKDGEPGKDGTGIETAAINRDDELVLTLTNGKPIALGRVVGKDGTDGKDGEPGIGFDDMEEVISDDGRYIVRRYKRGHQVKEFHFRAPAIIDRGIYESGKDYAPGDAVTWGGCLWICQKETASKPGSGDEWRLAVKRGRDGAPGPKGDPGKDAPK